MSGHLNRHTALATGATGGIGSAIARRLAAHGAAVLLAHLDGHQAATSLAEHITHTGGHAVPVTADLRDPDAVPGLCRNAHEQLGPIDVLISNAGA
ncbi:SDR family NAD(P)-dependent oxidoreductase [Streptomyces sp. LX-29]|uniref:SDR family NAD(P)-dependent oxidoreductase n=1 Tax=Streptomyces sp. LX-29 TaxID=2900152 RepID=UPI00240D542C|nr:SDR family NAD(P)-dependent oxidoreductase [Streptomyces sp. LX-29]